MLGHLGDLGLLALLRRLLLVAADGDVGALPRQLHEVLLGDGLGLLDAGALLAALAGPGLVLGDVDELAAAPGPPDTTASSRTSPTGRGRKPPPEGVRGAGRAMGMSGRESTTARVADGRICRFSVTCTDCTPPGPWTMGPVGRGAGGRAGARGGGGGAGRAATLGTPAGTLLTCAGGFCASAGRAGEGIGEGAWGCAATGFCSAWAATGWISGRAGVGGGGAGETSTGAATGAGGAASTTGAGTGKGEGSVAGAICCASAATGGGSGLRSGCGAGAGGGGGGAARGGSGAGAWATAAACSCSAAVSALLRRSTTPLPDALGASALGPFSPLNFSSTASAWSSSSDEEWLLTSYS